MSRVGALLLLALIGCGPELGEPGRWLAPDELTDDAQRPEVVLDAYPVTTPGDRLRIVSFNVHFGEDVAAIAEVLRAHPALAGADVIFLQELEAHPDEAGSRAARLAAALAMNFVYAPARPTDDGGSHGIAVLSPHRLDDVVIMELARAEVGFNSRRRIALGVDVWPGGDPAIAVHVVNVHLDLRLGVTERLRQLRPVVIDHPARVVIGGDLNTIPWAWAEGVIPSLPAQAAVDFDAAAAIDALMTAQGFAAPTAALGPTDQLPIASVRLDSIYVRGVTPLAATLGADVDVSDHLPISVDVATPPR